MHYKINFCRYLHNFTKLFSKSCSTLTKGGATDNTYPDLKVHQVKTKKSKMVLLLKARMGLKPANLAMVYFTLDAVYKDIVAIILRPDIYSLFNIEAIILRPDIYNNCICLCAILLHHMNKKKQIKERIKNRLYI